MSGAAGQVGYSAIFRIAAGEMFGPEQPIVLRMLEVEPAIRQLDAMAMELDDCNYPLLRNITVTSEPATAFDGASWALLLGAARRDAGMEHADLLAMNGGIFQQHGRALGHYARDDVRILVVGNPCNTNCLIVAHERTRRSPDRWFAMMRLDQNRAANQLAQKAGVGNAEVTNVVVWGNHSATQYPDALNARIGGRRAMEVIDDHDWLRNDFVRLVGQRGASIIEARGASSAASAATAVIDSVRSIETLTPDGTFVSLAVVSRGEHGVPEGLQFGFPVRVMESGWRVADDVDVDDFGRMMLQRNVDELLDERAAVAHLLL